MVGDCKESGCDYTGYSRYDGYCSTHYESAYIVKLERENDDLKRTQGPTPAERRVIEAAKAWQRAVPYITNECRSLGEAVEALEREEKS